MKSLIVLLGLLFFQPLFAQTEINMKDDGNGNKYTLDSLYYVFIDTSATPDDTLDAVVSKYWVTKYNYDWATVSILDTGASITDTVIVKYKYPYTTDWFPVEFIRDSTWTNVTQPLIDNASLHSYSFYIGDYYAIGIFLTNTATLDTGHVTKFNLQLSKKR